MNVVIYARASHQVEWGRRFAAGLKRHGIDAPIRKPEEVTPCDLAVFWGHRQQVIMNRQRARGAHYLVMERGYIGDRFRWTSLGFDGLNGRAKFPEIDDGGRRWREHFSQYIEPCFIWRGHGPFAVIMGQVKGDAAILGLDFDAWVNRMAKKLQQNGFGEVVFRRHPNERHQKVKVSITQLEGTLDQALQRARLVVTYNSNSGVDAVLAGVPTVAMDRGSMAWPVALHHIPKPAELKFSTYGQRSAWAKKMAFTQWLPIEIEQGEAWDALKQVNLS